MDGVGHKSDYTARVVLAIALSILNFGVVPKNPNPNRVTEKIALGGGRCPNHPGFTPRLEDGRPVGAKTLPKI